MIRTTARAARSFIWRRTSSPSASGRRMSRRTRSGPVSAYFLQAGLAVFGRLDVEALLRQMGRERFPDEASSSMMRMDFMVLPRRG